MGYDSHVCSTARCGAIAFSGHSAKAGTQLAANQSPEPFSNIGLSLAEDGFVVASVWLALQHPVVALVIVGIVVGLILWLLPKVYRLFKRQAGRLRSLFHGQLQEVTRSAAAASHSFYSDLQQRARQRL